MENNRRKKAKKRIPKGNTIIFILFLSDFIMYFGRILFAHMLGETGTGYYAAVYEGFAFLMIFIGWYLPQAESRMVRMRLSRGQVKNAGRVFKGTLLFVSVAGLVFCLITVLLSKPIADYILLQPLLSLAVGVMAPAFFVSAVISVYRGYFEGMGTAVPTCISRILEQVFYLGFGLLFARLLYLYGEKAGKLKQNPDLAAAYGVIGAAIGMIVAQFLILLFFIFINKSYASTFRRRRNEDTSKIQDSYAEIIRGVVIYGLPYIAMLLFVKGTVYISMLSYFHYTGKSTAQNYTLHYGSFYGKYGIFMGILVCPLCFLMVKPLAAIGQFHRREDYRAVKERFSGAIHAFSIYAIPMAVLVAVLAEPITAMLFGTVKGTVFLLQVSSSLFFLIPCAIFFNYVLQTIGKSAIALRNSAIAFLIHICAVQAFLRGMHIGIASVAYGYMVLFGLMVILNGMSLFRYLKYSPEYVRLFAVPLIASSVIGILDMLLSKALLPAAGGLVTSVVCILSGLAGYTVLLFVLKGVKEKELSKMPGGGILMKIGQILHLI